MYNNRIGGKMFAMTLAYTMFFDPLPIWVKPWFWPLLLLPLCLAVAVVYKCVRAERRPASPARPRDYSLPSSWE